MMCHLSPCVVAFCFGSSPSPCVAITCCGSLLCVLFICCGPLFSIVATCCGPSHLALPLLDVVPCLLLPFFVVVFHIELFLLVVVPCLVLLLFVVSFALHYYYLLWIFLTLLCRSTHFSKYSPHFPLLLLFVMVRHSSPCVVATCLSRWCTSPPLAMCRFWSLELEVLS